MEIRKQFKYEMAHIVRKAWSRRCSMNIHGHSYILEVFIKADEYDEAGMLIDFGIIKKYFNPFIDCFDHTCVLWNIEEDKDTIEFFKNKFERVIITNFPTSAEVQAEMFFKILSEKLELIKEKYNLKTIKISRVRVHETRTGYAEYTEEDFKNNKGLNIDFELSIWMSEQLEKEMKNE